MATLFNLSATHARNLPLVTFVAFGIGALLNCFNGHYYQAGVGASLGLCLGLAFAAKQYSKPLLAWVAGTTLLLALVLMGLEMHSHYLTAQAHRAQQAQTR